jgi:hypothetical protein
MTSGAALFDPFESIQGGVLYDLPQQHPSSTRGRRRAIRKRHFAINVVYPHRGSHRLLVCRRVSNGGSIKHTDVGMFPYNQVPAVSQTKVVG